MKKNETVCIKDAFFFVLNRPKGMLNVLWLLLPIIGWFILGGYMVSIVKGFTEGKFKELPKRASDAFTLGLVMFLKAIPFWIVYGLILWGFEQIGWTGTVLSVLIGMLIVPVLSVNFMKKQTVGSYFELQHVGAVFSHFGEYLIAVFKSIVLTLIWVVLILALVGIPGLTFTKHIFIADFYRKYVK